MAAAEKQDSASTTLGGLIRAKVVAVYAAAAGAEG